MQGATRIGWMGIIVAISVAVATPSWANPKKWVEQASVHYHAGRFLKAAKLLEKAYQAKPSAVLLYNLARCWENAGVEDRAIEAYQRYLEASPRSKDRALIRARIETLQENQAERKALVRALVDQPETETPKAPTSAPFSSQANDVALPNASVKTGRPPSIDTWPWLVAGAGVLALSTGAILGVTAQSRISDARESTVHQEAVRLDSEGRDLALGANIAFIAGGAMAITGAVFALLNFNEVRGAQSAEHVQVGVSPAGVQARIDW